MRSLGINRTTNSIFTAITTLHIIIKVACDKKESSESARSYRALGQTQKGTKLTKEAILSIAGPATALLKLLAEDQERMFRHLVAVVRLPFALHPHEPDVTGVDRSREETEQREDAVDPEIDAEAFNQPDPGGWEQEGENEADDLGGRVFAHFGGSR